MTPSAIKRYFADCVDEISKVVWPTKNELVRISIAVILLTILFTLFIGVLDFVFNTGYQVLLEL